MSIVACTGQSRFGTDELLVCAEKANGIKGSGLDERDSLTAQQHCHAHPRLTRTRCLRFQLLDDA
jgi:hypothetical protein